MVVETVPKKQGYIPYPKAEPVKAPVKSPVPVTKPIGA